MLNRSADLLWSDGYFARDGEFQPLSWFCILGLLFSLSSDEGQISTELQTLEGLPCSSVAECCPPSSLFALSFMHFRSSSVRNLETSARHCACDASLFKYLHFRGCSLNEGGRHQNILCLRHARGMEWKPSITPRCATTVD
jgi:hypothetical protein